MFQVNNQLVVIQDMPIETEGATIEEIIEEPATTPVKPRTIQTSSTVIDLTNDEEISSMSTFPAQPSYSEIKCPPPVKISIPLNQAVQLLDQKHWEETERRMNENSGKRGAEDDVLPNKRRNTTRECLDLFPYKYKYKFLV